MGKWFRAFLVGAGLIVPGVLGVAQAQPYGYGPPVSPPPPGVVIRRPPPPPMRYEVVPAPRPHYAWVRGHWVWTPRGYAWVGGYWRPMGRHWRMRPY